MPTQPWFWMMAVLLWGSSSAAAAPHLPQKWELRFSPGTQRVITLPREVRGFAVRDEGLIEVRSIGNNQLVIGATNPGDTRLLLFGLVGPVRSIDIHVRRNDMCLVICQLCNFLPKDTLIQLDLVEGTTLMVSGIAYTLEELRGVNLISQVAPFRVIVDVRLANERPLREALLRINHELWSEGFLDARAVVVGDRVQLTGRFASSGEELHARATVAPYVEWLEERLLPLQAPAP